MIARSAAAILRVVTAWSCAAIALLGSAVAYGAFVVLLSLIPGNSLLGRCSFLGCGGLVAGIGMLLIVTGRRGAGRAAPAAANAP